MANNKKEEEGLSNFWHTITIIGLIIVLVAMIIAFVVQSISYGSDYVEKSRIDKMYIKKDTLAFSDLPKHIRTLYISKVEISETEERLNENVKMVEKSTFTGRYLDNITLVSQIECDNFKPVEHVAPISCQNKLIKELSKMNDNMIYEIIPMVNNKDFNFIQRIVDESLNEDEKIEYKEKMHDLLEYANRGLSHYRANEAIWILKQHISKDVKIKTSSFHMFTKDKAGFIVKIFNYIE